MAVHPGINVLTARKHPTYHVLHKTHVPVKPITGMQVRENFTDQAYRAHSFQETEFVNQQMAELPGNGLHIRVQLREVYITVGLPCTILLLIRLLILSMW